MKRIALWLLSTVSVVVLLFGYHTSTSGPAATTQEPVGASLATTSNATTSGGSGSGSGSGSGVTVTGQVSQTRWGPVQVRLTADAAGTITSVEVIQYPSGNREDEEINSYALPRLVQATLDAQSANIDMVSGATVTSEGYVRSLQSALDQVPA